MPLKVGSRLAGRADDPSLDVFHDRGSFSCGPRPRRKRPSPLRTRLSELRGSSIRHSSLNKFVCWMVTHENNVYLCWLRPLCGSRVVHFSIEAANIGRSRRRRRTLQPTTARDPMHIITMADGSGTELVTTSALSSINESLSLNLVADEIHRVVDRSRPRQGSRNSPCTPAKTRCGSQPPGVETELMTELACVAKGQGDLPVVAWISLIQSLFPECDMRPTSRPLSMSDVEITGTPTSETFWVRVPKDPVWP